MTAPGVSPVAYGYDAASRLTSVSRAPLAPATLQYDDAGRRTQLTLPNQVSTAYQYDPASRLTALLYRNAADPLGDLTYQYDAAGNRASVGGSFARTLLPDPVPTATYDAANRQLAFGTATMAYAPVSKRVVRQTQADGGVWNFSFVVPAPPGSGGGCADFCVTPAPAASVTVR